MTGTNGRGGGPGGRPLLTLALFSYNHGRYLRDAVAGAFAQTYSPLQIILTDDCSLDDSFRIMEEMAGSYRGPHEIALNRNPGNLGRGGSLNRVMELAKGELVLVADGDDVPLETRAERSCEEWERSGGNACSIFADGITIDAEGRERGRWFGGKTPRHARTPEQAVARGTAGVAGFSHAFSRRCFDVFGPLEGLDCSMDMTVPFRSLLLGEVRYLHEPLVRYRVHGGNISVESGGRPTLAFRARQAKYHENACSSWLHDVRTAEAKGLISGERAERIRKSLLLRQYWLTVAKRYYRSGAIGGLWALLSSAWEAGSLSPALKLMDRKRRSRA